MLVPRVGVFDRLEMMAGKKWHTFVATSEIAGELERYGGSIRLGEDTDGDCLSGRRKYVYLDRFQIKLPGNRIPDYAGIGSAELDRLRHLVYRARKRDPCASAVFPCDNLRPVTARFKQLLGRLPDRRQFGIGQRQTHIFTVKVSD